MDVSNQQKRTWHQAITQELVNTNTQIDDKASYAILILYAVRLLGFDGEEPLPTDLNQLNKLFATSTDGTKVYFLKSLSIQSGQRVYECRMVSPTGQEYPDHYVLKWIPTIEGGSILDEAEKWKRARDVGVKAPFFDDTYRFWGQPTLVMEKLRPLNKTDNSVDIGLSVLEDLSKLHTIGIHCDIKPDNILCSLHPPNIYYLIDFDGLSTEPLWWGYKRLAFSPVWTSQVNETVCVATAKNDLKELAYALNMLDRLQDRYYEDAQIADEAVAGRFICKPREYIKDNPPEELVCAPGSKISYDPGVTRVIAKNGRFMDYYILASQIDERNIPADIYNVLADSLIRAKTK